MATHNNKTGRPSPATLRSHPLAETASHLLHRLFRQLPWPLPLRLWNGALLQLGAPCADRPGFTLVCHHPALVGYLVLGSDPLRLAEAYLQGDVDVEGDFFAALALKDHLHQLRLPWHERLPAALQAWRLLRAGRRPRVAPSARRAAHHRPVLQHSRQENRQAIAFHYDVSNDFYALWLDRAMVYSCAYFEHPQATLEEAQTAKLEHICRKLLLRPGLRLLDIGCGWGALVLHAARHHGVRSHGITLSRQQLELARQRIAEAGLQDRVTVELLDYRDLPAGVRYDRIASVGMFEHIGLKNLPLYFQRVQALLEPGGLFLNHGITHSDEGWQRNLSSTFINRYVFPDGQLDTIGNITRRMEQQRFEVLDVESLRPHYALTLRHWVRRLEQQHAAALQHVDEATWRVWRLYMAASALEFEAGDIGIYQILACRRGELPPALPLTRRHLYPPAQQDAQT